MRSEMSFIIKTAVSCLVISAPLACISNLPAFAESTNKAAGKSTKVELPFAKRTAGDIAPATADKMLNDLRDTRLSLNQLKQQAINLFLEATRIPMTVDDAPVEQSPVSISSAMLDANKKYLAPRKEWLVLYVNMLEPIVHLLCQDISDVDTNGLGVSKAIADRVNPLWKTWRADVLAINKALDQVQDSLPVGSDPDSADSNSVIAKAALEIFQRAEDLEKVRYQSALISIEEYKKEAAAKGAAATTAAGK
jgi:hypothetical protein